MAKTIQLNGKAISKKDQIAYCVILHGRNVYLQGRPKGPQLFAVKMTSSDDPKQKLIETLGRKVNVAFTKEQLLPLSSKNYHDKDNTVQSCLVFKIVLDEPLGSDPLRTYFPASVEEIKEGKLSSIRDISKEIISKNVFLPATSKS